MSVRSRWALFSLGVLVLAGCGAAADESETNSDDEVEAEVRAGTAYRYECSAEANLNWTTPTVLVTLSSHATKITVVELFDNGRQATYAGTYDPNYSGSASYAQYLGFDPDLGDSVLVAKGLRTGSATGLVKVRYHYDGFEQAYLHCSRSTRTAHREPAAHTPEPFATMSVGRWMGDDAQATAPNMREIRLDRDGHYYGRVWGDTVENGEWSVPRGVTSYPLNIRFQSGSFVWHGTIAGFGQPLTYTRGSATGVVAGTWGNDDESKCDDSHGQWRDDESNGDGLFCDCPSGTAFIPSQGGCVQ